MATDLTPLTSLNQISNLKLFGGPSGFVIGATPHDNINGGAATVYGIVVDARLNTQEDVHWKAANATSATVGSTAAHIKIKARAGTIQAVMFAPGKSMGTGLSAWCVKEADDTGTTAPSGTVKHSGEIV